MAYSIYIGEARLEPANKYPGIHYTHYDIDVEETELPDAPVWPNPDGVWGDISGKSNGRHPGYSQMSAWARTAGVYEVWFDKRNGLLSLHPGCAVLRPVHLDAHIEALEQWKREHPEAEPGWQEGEDAILARLIWYGWWMRWALDNCEHPAVCNR